MASFEGRPISCRARHDGGIYGKSAPYVPLIAPIAQASSGCRRGHCHVPGHQARATMVTQPSLNASYEALIIAAKGEKCGERRPYFGQNGGEGSGRNATNLVLAPRLIRVLTFDMLPTLTMEELVLGQPLHRLGVKSRRHAPTVLHSISRNADVSND
jgi:hypothetical protein